MAITNKNRASVEAMDQAIAEVMAGESKKVAAERNGVAYRSMLNRLRQLRLSGTPVPKRKSRTQDYADALKEVLSGAGQNAMARKYNISAGTLNKLVREARLDGAIQNPGFWHSMDATVPAANMIFWGMV